jgi:hypothetical protein
VTGQKRKRKRMLNRTGPTTNAPTPGNKSTGKRKWEARRMTPTKETATRATRTRDPMNCRKSNSGDRNKITSATLPAISEVPKEKEQEICQPPSQKSQESQDKNKNTSGSRTNGRETRRNALPNRDRRHINRRLTNVRSDWQEFKLISFNVRGLNSESKQKIIYDLLKHNRP